MASKITIRDAAKMIGVTPKTLRIWEKEGNIKSSRTLGGHRRFDMEVIQNVIEQSSTKNMKCIGNHFFVQFPEGPLQEKITLKSGFELYIPSFLDAEKWATIEGIFHSAGKSIKDVNGQPVLPGDTIAVSYHIISNYEWIHDTRHYKNVFVFDDIILWKGGLGNSESAEQSDMIAVKRGDEWVAIGEWVLLKELKKPLDETQQRLINAGLALPEYMEHEKWENHAEFFSGDLEGVSRGDTVLFIEKYRSIYTFPDNQTFIVLNKDRIEGKLNG